ncbi:probable cytochrome P450 28a5 [Drosophila guanche]|uniref:Blast:Probable cytochrome P450 28a5 n=1 Tax=Drosophila guanche TaxID=7266 RepID=A0A3B0K3E0_DROGU|nr:probable cytochrome P450 28a5 [Drosophila guanche]SPP88745.1 blast:Probable cytochrome P450 28a5 [Drosophila guanche]
MILITLALGLATVGLLYLLMTWNFDHWRKRRVPGPKPKVPTGNYPNMYTMKRNAIYDINDIYVKYKNKYDAVGVFGGRVPQLLVVNPELGRRVFVSDFKHFHDNEVSKMIDEKTDFIFANNPFSLTGENWKQRRADVTPGLTMSRIKTVYPVTNKVCQKLSQWVDKQIRLGAPEGINAKDMSLCFTSEMVTDCVLGLSAESFSDNPTPIMGHIKDLFNQPWTFLLYFVAVSTFPCLSRLIKLRFVPPKVEQFFVGLMENAVQTRRAQLAGGKQFERTDFLDYMLQLAEKRHLNTRQLLTHTMTFLLDGFETTASVLAHMLLLLGRNPEAQQRLREEIRAHVKDGIVTFEKLNELPFLDACVQETIRIFPPAFMSIKLCTEAIELPNKDGPNFTVDVGTSVVVPHYCFMLDEDYFPEAQSFQPDRFMEPDAAKKFRESGTFMGFGDGPRVCIGMRFAMAQIKAAAVELITKYNVKVNPKTRKDNLYDPVSFITSLQGGIWLDLEAL